MTPTSPMRFRCFFFSTRSLLEMDTCILQIDSCDPDVYVTSQRHTVHVKDEVWC
jgi:hypothetical protein